jgi:hypothetical protein
VPGRAYGRLLLGLLAAGAIWLTWPHGPAAQEAAAPTTRDGSHRYVGVAGCAAAACHGGNGPPGAKGSEYSTWAGLDRHPNAFAVLYDKRSERMVRALYGSKAKPATETEVCLKCHATNEGRTHGQGDRFVLADGVGCESCHGPAGDWLTTHYLPDWKGKSAGDKAALGFRNTKDLLARAKLCTECHVGTADRDVNHDLIAAGHPRLNFEFASFHAIYPKHWPQRPELERHPDLHARLWEIGQAVTAEAAVELLRTRAEKGRKGTGPWPEFAEYACYACHKDLKADSPRQQAGYGGRRPGDFPWGTWYFTMAPAYADQPGGVGGGLDEPLGKLRELMERPGPDEAAVARQAGAVAATLKGWAGRVHASGPLDAAQVRGLMRAVAAAGEKRADTLDWDQAAQYYLALAALHQGLGDLSGRRPPARLTDDLLRMRRKLQGAFPPGYDSPLRFNPLAEPSLRALFAGARGQLGP